MNISKRNRKVCRVVLIPMPQVKESKVIECEITQEWNGSIPPSLFSFFSQKPQKFAPQSLLCMPNCFFSCGKSRRKEGRTKAQKTELKSQMVNSTMKVKGKPQTLFGADLFRIHRTEKIRWYHFKCLTMNESSESHFWLSLGIREISSLAAD